MLDTSIVQVEVPEGCNIILGQAHFIKTAEDIYEAVVSSVPGIQFALAFSEASGPRLVRCEGTNIALKSLAGKTALQISSGHSFVIYLQGAFPINVLNALKNLSEVCQIFCATANPVQVLIAQTEQGRGVLGVIDGYPPLGLEEEGDVSARRTFLRKIGYKN